MVRVILQGTPEVDGCTDPKCVGSNWNTREMWANAVTKLLEELKDADL